ncbi:MAG: DUF1858 domain-containing protein [Bacilli bacterium]|nr:DUF1858 domain-containing protein [Bacilli bacterium]HHU23788.1 DUF1858 domain-containing protein [Acholeplasmataceae bacterium]
MIEISIHTPIAELIKNYPEIKEIMLSLGFDNIANPIMLKTVGRFMTLSKGSELKDISMEHMKNVFAKHGFTLVE